MKEGEANFGPNRSNFYWRGSKEFGKAALQLAVFQRAQKRELGNITAIGGSCKIIQNSSACWHSHRVYSARSATMHLHCDNPECSHPCRLHHVRVSLNSFSFLVVYQWSGTWFRVTERGAVVPNSRTENLKFLQRTWRGNPKLETQADFRVVYEAGGLHCQRGTCTACEFMKTTAMPSFCKLSVMWGI